MIYGKVIKSYKKDHLIVLATLSLRFILQQASMFSKTLGFIKLSPLKILWKSLKFLLSAFYFKNTNINSIDTNVLQSCHYVYKTKFWGGNFPDKFSLVSKQFTGSSPGHLISKSHFSDIWILTRAATIIYFVIYYCLLINFFLI